MLTSHAFYPRAWLKGPYLLDGCSGETAGASSADALSTPAGLRFV